MTNGEKFKRIFGVSQVDEGELYAYAWLPNHAAAEFSIDWWNAEYKESTTKNVMLDKIKQAREEIENEVKFWSEPIKCNVGSVVNNARKAKAQSYKHCLEIFDKLITESEEV